MNKKLQLAVLPDTQLKLFEKLTSQSFISAFYLAGGTGLALQIGHRQSLDFDFFIPDDFENSLIINSLTSIGDFVRGNEDKNTINGRLNGVRISFFGYKYQTIDRFETYRNIRIAGLRDIAAMKLEAIAGRGSKKDFIDLYFLLKMYSLKEIFTWHAKKYGLGLNNQYHHLKSLVYFTDAEAEAMPVMMKPLSWSDVKIEIISHAKQYDLL
ncbi:MAG: nucleotidyl transferase AbiEii/AbiGii toxin family protein [Bacteroidales bacterium]|nr:nucleotidyl transferase AbiEii/AbiGii toxin family protein [Bacteroidales bacterium]